MSDNDGRTPARPILPHELQVLRDSKASLIALKADLDRAKKAGIDVTEQEKQRVENLAKIEQILSVYG